MHPGTLLAGLTLIAAGGGWWCWHNYSLIRASRPNLPVAESKAGSPESNAEATTLAAAMRIAEKLPELEQQAVDLEKENTGLRKELAVTMGGPESPPGEPSAPEAPATAPIEITTLEAAAAVQKRAVDLENRIRELSTDNSTLRRRIAEEIEAKKPPPTPDEVAARIIAQRELAFTRTPVWTAAPPEDIIKRISDKATEGITEDAARNRGRAWRAMGFIPDGPFDYHSAVASIAGMKPGGFYDAAEGKFYYQSAASLARSDSRDVFAGALFPVLLSQNFQLPDVPADNDDRLLAQRALAQGDASFSRVRFSIGDQLNSNFDRGQAPSAPPPSPNAPQFMTELWKWSEDAGNLFAQNLHTTGGLTAVNAAWKRPPQSSAEILHPEKLYLANPPFQPVDVTFPDLKINDTAPLFTNVAGEIGAYFLVRTFADVDYATAATEGWTGDRYVVWPGSETYGDQVLWRTVWASEKDAAEFFDAMRRGLMQRHHIPWQKEYDSTPGQFRVDDPHRIIRLMQKGSTVTLIDATDLGFASTLEAQIASQ